MKTAVPESWTAQALRLGLLATLYLSQGLPFGFFSQALPVLLRTRGVSLPAIGASHLLALPWALKFLVAPAMDRLGWERWGRRRSFILPLQFLAMLCCLLLAGLDAGGQLELLFLGVFVLNLVAALQDIATDGLAVELLTEKERGLGNGVQVGAYRVGMILGGGFLLIASTHLGWPWTFVVMGGLLLIATVPIALYREPFKSRPSSSNVWTGFRAWFQRPALDWLGVVALYKFGDSFSTGMLRPFLVDRGFTVEDLGWLLGTLSFTTGLLGALAGGWVSTRLGRRRSLWVLGLIQSTVLMGYAFQAWSLSPEWLYIICAVEHFTGGMATVALFTAMMDATRTELAATDYTVQASASVIAGGLASSLSGLSAQSVGYAAHFLIGGVLSFAGVLWAARVDFSALWQRSSQMVDVANQ